MTGGAGPIAVVGITDHGPDSLLPPALALVEGAELLCGGERHLAFFPAHTAERFVVTSNLDALANRLRVERRPTVVLASGDPCCYGIGPYLAERLGLDRVQILPNVSAVQVAFARLGESWHDATILSAHGRPLESILRVARTARKAVILTDTRNTPSEIARALLDAGDDDHARIDVFEHVGGSRERHVAGRPSEFVDQSFAPLNLVVIRRTAPAGPWSLGLPEDAFAHRQGMITKAEIRAVTLAKMRLHEGFVLWDIGAGCGSVSIEASALVQHGCVYAVERDPEQLTYLEENRRRFGAGNVCIVAEEAPSALADLPLPDAVFVGGSGGQLGPIVCASMDRLCPDGRLVANLATLEHVTELLGLARAAGWSTEIVQVGVARGTDAAGLTRLASLNPVFIVSLSGGA
ncbi:MAG: precorrin-6y C5,15-methyltransferase (decarboxylating) subunit CbiE [Chloroflexi bacterium]|nr:precorrin-6y C5,15-methyltransferase (decarboxylating) subunit CbiE [Chloroflexota bacterium]